MKKIRVSPSIMAGNFGKIHDEARRIQDSGADMVHIDIMDGHFVPNLTFGPQTVAAINRATDLFLEVHLMMYNVYDYVERFVEAGADRIIFHFESTEDVEETLSYIKRCNIEAGLAFCPDTSESFIPKYLDKCDLLLLMTVNPGFSGQSFISSVLEKVSFARDLCNKLDIRKGGVTPKNEEDPASNLPPFLIGVDGGIDYETAKQSVKAGANELVSGSYLLHSSDMKEEVKKLHELGKN